MGTGASPALRRLTACGLRMAPVIAVVAELHFNASVVYHCLVELRVDDDSAAYRMMLDFLGWAGDDQGAALFPCVEALFVLLWAMKPPDTVNRDVG